LDPTIVCPTLITPRLKIRVMNFEDADFLFKEWSNPKVTYFMRDEEPLKSRGQAEEFICQFQNPEKISNSKWWGIELKETHQLIGTCGYLGWNCCHRHAEIGYDLSPNYWGQGLMVEALQILLNYGFSEMNLNRIQAMTHSDNYRSQKVLLKLGFLREGVLREYFGLDGIFNDQIQYSILKKEWLSELCEENMI